jgi:hypothetical protein
MQYGFLAVEILVNGSFGYLGLFGDLVDAGFVLTVLTEQLLRGTFDAFLNFVGFHVSV